MSPTISRRRLLQAAGVTGASVVGSAAVSGLPAAAAPGSADPTIEAGVAWYDVSSWGVEGKGWADTGRFYDRLPARAEAMVRGPVWTLSRQSAGLATRFETDSTSFHARYTLSMSRLAMHHMPATGVSGLDLYARLDDGRDHWLAGTSPTSQTVAQQMVSGIDPGSRLYTAYLPLYNGIDSLQIGVDEGAAFRPVAPRVEKPAVFYGTSIMQGGVASRPGMSITAVLSRWFDMPTINLGFSGNGTMDPPVGELMTELDASVYVIDCCPNMTPAQVADRTEPLVRMLREARPDVPILLVEDRNYSNGVLRAASRERNAGNHQALRDAYMRLLTGGVKHLSYLSADELMGTDGEGAVDGSHPSDLGGMRYCEAYRKALRPILAG
jgi:GDSL-like lipase/acylhydrolase family protein/SGNH-like hydrolase/esterase family protein